MAEMTEGMRLFIEAEAGRLSAQEYVATWREAKCATCKTAKVQCFVKGVNSCYACAEKQGRGKR